MAACDNTYSRVVAWLRIALPLLALAILSTLFLLARTIDPAQNLPYADIDIDELTREQRIGNPQFAAVHRRRRGDLARRRGRPGPIPRTKCGYKAATLPRKSLCRPERHLISVHGPWCSIGARKRPALAAAYC